MENEEAFRLKFYHKHNVALNAKISLPIIKVFIILAIFSFVTIFLIQSAKADVISINSGGDNNTAITPSNYIENFFFGINPGAPVSNETNGTTGGGGTSGGGGGGGAAPSVQVTPTEFNINLAVNTTTQRTITVTNPGNFSVTVSAINVNLGSHVIIQNQNLTLAAGQSGSINVVFVALDKPGIFTGMLTVGGQQVLVSLNVKTSFLLFDSNIVVLNPNYQVQQGDQLLTRITLIPLGSQESTDVTLAFTIRDYSGRVYLTKSETMMINKLTSINRNFDTGTLPPGNYIIGLQLTYGTSVAPSSAHFQVTKKTTTVLGTIITFLIILILLILILIIAILVWRRIKKMREQEAASESSAT